MNIDGLLNRYFNGLRPKIDVFDDESIHRVYSDVVNLLKACPEIELSVLQLLSYCFYEILDNVVTLKRNSTIVSLIRRIWMICGKLIGGKDMVTFKFNQFGEYLGTRMLGVSVREQLLPLINSGEKVVLDFEGVDVVSNSFADECLAKLLLTMSLDDLKQRTTFRGLNDFAKKNIALAFKRRLYAMQST
jgi:hypothetical protein